MARLSATAVEPELRIKYPHFGSGDAEVWEQWLWNNQADLIAVYYDVALGGVILDDPSVDEKIRLGWQYNTAVKIDAVAEFPDVNFVCEVKPHAHMGAIGQAFGYSGLLDEDPINDKENQPVIVCFDTSAEVRKVAAALGILIEQVKR